MSERAPEAQADVPPHRPSGEGPWWREAVIYEVYPRSFADSDGDGEGDVDGLRARLPYLADLGVDAVWIAPWFPSPMADGGYDVSDYCDIDPRFGTLADADAMLAEAHAHGLRVIVDLVSNHTSSQHPWFQEALRSPRGSAARDRYLFRDGRGRWGEEPPNNWISNFGGIAWTRVTEPDGSPGQWYCHTFDPQQPDLNWDSEEVRGAFDDILRFWLDRGVDGFRVDAAPAMAKAPGLPDAVYGPDLRFAPDEWVGNPHWDVDGVHDILRRWRRLVDRYQGERVFVAESVVNGPARLARYLRPDELHTAFNFDYIHARWDPYVLRGVIEGTLAAIAPIGAPATWAMSNHDEMRHATRFAPGDPILGTRRARAAVLLMLALPGGAYLYQGEELGLPEVTDLPDHVLQDPVFKRSGGRSRGRDGCRVPLPWSGDAPPYGFGPAGTTPWLPQPDRWRELSAERQARDPDSMLSLYREALRLRREIAGFRGETLTWNTTPGPVLDFDRGEGLRCVANLGAVSVPLSGRPLLTSVPLEGGALPPDATAWVDPRT